MPAYDLVPHPDFASHAATAVRVFVSRPAARTLRLSYLVTAPLRELHLPKPRPAERRDELWRTTCLELFVEQPQGYCEVNLSPSSEWAAYAFTAYRAGMHTLEDLPLPIIDQNGGSQWYEMVATVELPLINGAALGLTAVIEATDGSKSYWALAHAPGLPDFHNLATWTAGLPAIG